MLSYSLIVCVLKSKKLKKTLNALKLFTKLLKNVVLSCWNNANGL